MEFSVSNEVADTSNVNQSRSKPRKKQYDQCLVDLEHLRLLDILKFIQL